MDGVQGIDDSLKFEGTGQRQEAAKVEHSYHKASRNESLQANGLGKLLVRLNPSHHDAHHAHYQAGNQAERENGHGEDQNG
jgi:hypothetical protein